MILKVKGCGSCPFWDYVDGTCNHPNLQTPMATQLWDCDGDRNPNWCPLKSEPITIELLVNDESE